LLGLLPPNAILPTDTSACICYNIVDGHPVVCMTFKPPPPEPKPPPEQPPGGTTPPTSIIFPPETPPEPSDLGGLIGAITGWTLKGDPFTGTTPPAWTAQQIIDELGAGFVGAMLDCWASATQQEKDALIQELDACCNIIETIGTEPDPNNPRDETTQALYDFLKTLACDLMNWLFDPSCNTTDGSKPEDLAAALILAQFCQHTLLDEIMRKMQRCAAAPPQTPPSEEEAAAGPVADTRTELGGCACYYWPGWVICPHCTATSGYKCTCPGLCIPFPVGSRAC